MDASRYLGQSVLLERKVLNMLAIWRNGMVACAILVVTTLLAPAMAQTTPATLLDQVIARGVLRVGVSGDYKPFSIRTGDAMEGLDVDMAQNLGTALGVKVEVVQFAWPSLMADLQAGKFDIAMGGITITLPRQKLAYFSTPVMRSGKTAIARCADKARFDTLADIDQPATRVIVNPGGTNESFDRANLKQAQIVMFTDNARIFDELVANHADVMITDGVETLLQQKLHPELCAIHPDRPFNTSELAYMLPRDATWKMFVDQWLNVLTVSGARQALVAKWLD